LNVMIRTSSLPRLLILAFFLSFNPWDLYSQGYLKKNNNNNNNNNNKALIS